MRPKKKNPKSFCFLPDVNDLLRKAKFISHGFQTEGILLILHSKFGYVQYRYLIKSKYRAKNSLLIQLVT